MFAERLSELRKEKDKSRKDVADVLTVSEKALGYYERGDRTPDFDNLINLADYFDVSLDYLLGRSDEKNTSDQVKKEILNSTKFSLDIFKMIVENEELLELNKKILDNYKS